MFYVELWRLQPSPLINKGFLGTETLDSHGISFFSSSHCASWPTLVIAQLVHPGEESWSLFGFQKILLRNPHTLQAVHACLCFLCLVLCNAFYTNTTDVIIQFTHTIANTHSRWSVQKTVPEAFFRSNKLSFFIFLIYTFIFLSNWEIYWPWWPVLLITST